MKRKQPFSTEEFGFIYSRVPRLTVEVILVIEGGVVLVERQEPSWYGLWHIPGGTVFYKERLVDAVKRVAQEELGIDVQVGELLGYIEYPSEEAERGFGWSTGIAFKCQALTQPNRKEWEKNNVKVF